MRKKRILLKSPNKKLDLFYKIITNSKSPGRGKEIVFITHDTFSKIVRAVQTLQIITKGKRYSTDIAQLLNEIRWGARYEKLSINTYDGPYNYLIESVPRRVFSSYLTKAVNLLNLNVEDHKITLNTLYTTGKIMEVSKSVGFDPIYECMRYGIPVI